MTTQRLIGIHGRKGAGKDTAYDVIQRYAERHGYTCARRAFADKMKLVGMRALGFVASDEELLEGANLLKGDGIIKTVFSWVPGVGLAPPATDGRGYWQSLGGAVRDLLGEDVWINAILPQPGEPVRPWFGGAYFCVVTDVRRDNEAQRIKDLGGEIWHLDADERLGPNLDGDISEAGIDPRLVDVTFKANDTEPPYPNFTNSVTEYLVNA